MIWNLEVQSPIKESTVQGAPDIVRMVQDESVTKNIEFDELSTVDMHPDPCAVNGSSSQIDTAGVSFPIIRVNDYVFDKRNIKSFSMASVDFMPTASLSLQFSDKAFINKNMPKDGDMMSVYIRTNNEKLMYIRCDFIITSCSTQTFTNKADNYVTINGRLFVKNFDATAINTMGYIGTTKELIREIAKKFSIGFVYNDFENTNDLQNWINCNCAMEPFIKDVMKHCWKDGTSFFKSWIDFYYDLCFINVNKFLLTEGNDEVVDITYVSNVMNMYTNTTDVPENNKNGTVKVLTNASTFKTSPFYIKKWTPMNNSTEISMMEGYETANYVFVHNQNIMNENVDDSFEITRNLPAYDQSKLDSYIILRGRSRYDKNKNPDNEMARANYNWTDDYVTNSWCGVEYMMNPDEKEKDNNNTWSGNVHANYTHAVDHNKININELNKISLRVECDGLCLQVMRGERIPVYIVHETAMDNTANNQTTDNDIKRDDDRFYSGYYVVDSVTYNYEPETDSGSLFKTVFTLQRREWPTPEAI